MPVLGLSTHAGLATATTYARHAGACRLRIVTRYSQVVGRSRARADSAIARSTVATYVDNSNDGPYQQQSWGPSTCFVTARNSSARCTRRRWIGGIGAGPTAASAGGLQGRTVGGLGGGVRGVGARTMSSYIDALRETAVSHGIERVVNGSLDSRAIGVVSHDHAFRPSDSLEFTKLTIP